MNDTTQDLSTARLIVLRLTYALVALGQVLFFWPKFISHSSEWALRYGDQGAIFSGMAILMVIGIRYPVRMLPILIFEFTWKCLWIIGIYLPLAQANRVTPEASESLFNVGVGVVVCGLAIPWGFVFRQFLSLRTSPTVPSEQN